MVDGATVITGSFNFTKAAEESNAENLLVVADTEMAAKYAQNWVVHRQHSELCTGLASGGQSPKSNGRKR